MIKENKKKLNEGFFDDYSWKDWSHLSLDVISIAASLFPGVGTGVSVIADLANAAWYYTEGKTVTAGLYALMAIPFVGDAFAIPVIGALKLGGKGLSKIPGASKLFDKIISNSALIKKFIEKLFNLNLTKPAAKALDEILESAIEIEAKEGAKAAEKWLAKAEAEVLAESGGKKLGQKITEFTANRMVKASKSGLKRVIPKSAGAIFDPDSESAKPSGTKSGGYAWRSCPDTLLKVGCRGENVRRMQQKLVDCGFSLPKYGVDGKFKYETKATVKQFQKANKLKVDGIAGVETLQALENCGLSGKPASTVQPSQETFTVDPTVDPQQPAYRRMGDDQDYYVTPSGGAVNIPGKPYSTNSMEGDEYEGGVKKIKKESKLYTHNKLIRERNERIEKLVFERMVKNANRL